MILKSLFNNRYIFFKFLSNIIKGINLASESIIDLQFASNNEIQSSISFIDRNLLNIEQSSDQAWFDKLFIFHLFSHQDN